jgi:hypothetical protein
MVWRSSWPVPEVGPRLAILKLLGYPMGTIWGPDRVETWNWGFVDLAGELRLMHRIYLPERGNDGESPLVCQLLPGGLSCY